MDQYFLKAQVKGKIKNLTANYGPNKFFEAQVKGKIENLNANCGPKKIEGPIKREIRELNCQLWNNNFWRTK